MDARVKLSVDVGEDVNLVLTGPTRTVTEMVERLRGVGGRFFVAGGKFCWTLSRDGTTLHILLDQEQEKVA